MDEKNCLSFDARWARRISDQPIYDRNLHYGTGNGLEALGIYIVLIHFITLYVVLWSL